MSSPVPICIWCRSEWSLDTVCCIQSIEAMLRLREHELEALDRATLLQELADIGQEMEACMFEEDKGTMYAGFILPPSNEEIAAMLQELQKEVEDE